MRITAIMLIHLLMVFQLRAGVPKDITKKEDIAEYQLGTAAAGKDLKKGIINYEIIGLPGPTAPKLKKRAKEEFGIDIIFHGCVPGPRVHYDRGYLDTVIESLRKKYRFDPIEKMDRELQNQKSDNVKQGAVTNAPQPTASEYK